MSTLSCCRSSLISTDFMIAFGPPMPLFDVSFDVAPLSAVETASCLSAMVRMREGAVEEEAAVHHAPLNEKMDGDRPRIGTPTAFSHTNRVLPGAKIGRLSFCLRALSNKPAISFLLFLRSSEMVCMPQVGATSCTVPSEGVPLIVCDRAFVTVTSRLWSHQ